MQVLKLITRESRMSFRGLVGLAAVSGIANAGLLALINHIIGREDDSATGFSNLLLFALVIAVFYFSKKYILHRSTIIVEKVVSRLRMRIADKIRKSELAVIENIGRSDIYARVTQDANYISQTAAYLINACQSAVMIGASVLYLAWLSVPAFMITAVAVAGGFVFYTNRQKLIRSDIRTMFKKETEFFESLNEILSGIKELKLHHRKNERLYESFVRLARETEEVKIRTGFHYVHNFSFSQMFFYVLIGIMIFILPKFGGGDTATTTKLVTALLFIVGPIESLVGSVQLFSKANVAAQNIEALERQLEQAADPRKAAGPTAAPWPDDPYDIEPLPFNNSIELQHLEFEYSDSAGGASFRVGPLDLSINKGERLFIVGGNGSGKSTLLKLIAGLYFPEGGRIAVDGRILMLDDYPAYRELFSAVFTDFHLFKFLYGVEQSDPQAFSRLLAMLQLDAKTSFADGRFSDLNLSTGQRKRLALIAAIVEDRDILVFDEAAADQDPEFKRHFYETLLPELSARGKTIIAVTHDDAYFDRAHRVVKMEFGAISRAVDV